MPGFFVSVRTRCICSVTARRHAHHDAGMEATTKLQKAGRNFLMRLAKHGLRGAMRVLRALPDELELAADSGDGRR